jgi:predicted alpha/beta-fold hydrolase
LSKIKSFWEYDNQVVAKLYGFKNAHDYYAQSSSRQFLKKITVPTLLIQAKDDPFMTTDVIPNTNELASCVKLELTQNGGHVGFITGKNPFRPVYWLEQRIVTFLIKNYLS